MGLLHHVWRALGVALLVWISYILNYTFACHWRTEGTAIALFADPQMEGHDRVRREGWYGAFNNDLNDMYFRHIFTSFLRAIKPPYAIVLGDLFSRQDISDAEFKARLRRYQYVFDQGEVAKPVFLINVTGNHDIGYGAEVTDERVRRFERAFGRVNEDFLIAGHRVINVNSMNLDGSTDTNIEKRAWDALTSAGARAEAHNEPVMVITHIPLHKDKGYCVDDPTMVRARGGAVVQQNMLSPETSQRLLRVLHPVAVLNGHDHEGCFFVHKLADGAAVPEFTLRAMMGGYGGYGAVFEIVLDATRGTSLEAATRDRAWPHVPNSPYRLTDNRYAYHFSACAFRSMNEIVAMVVITMIYLFCTIIWYCMSCIKQRRAKKD